MTNKSANMTCPVYLQEVQADLWSATGPDLQVIRGHDGQHLVGDDTGQAGDNGSNSVTAGQFLHAQLLDGINIQLPGVPAEIIQVTDCHKLCHDHQSGIWSQNMISTSHFCHTEKEVR